MGSDRGIDAVALERIPKILLFVSGFAAVQMRVVVSKPTFQAGVMFSFASEFLPEDVACRFRDVFGDIGVSCDMSFVIGAVDIPFGVTCPAYASESFCQCWNGPRVLPLLEVILAISSGWTSLFL